MTAGDDDWPVVVGNLRKARKSWGGLSRILSREGDNPKMSGDFFKAVIQVVLLSGVDTWVLTPRMYRPLVVSNTGLRDGSPEGSQGDGGMGFGNTHHWRRQCWKQDLRVSEHTSQVIRTRLRSIL